MAPDDHSGRRRFCLAAIAAVAAAACERTPLAAPLSSGRLPHLAFSRLDGSPAAIDDYAGRALVLNLWATWCGPCRAEMPSLQRLADAFSPDELAVVAVTVDDDLNLVREFLLRYAIRFPVYADTGRPAVRSSLGVTVFPTTWLVRRDGHIAEVVVGERDWADAAMIARIAALLDAQPRPAVAG